MIKNILKKVSTRIRNPKVATAVVSGILMILVNTGIISVHMSNSILAGFNTILGILVGLGVFSNPDSHVNDNPVQDTPTPIAKPEPVIKSVAPSNQPLPTATPAQPTEPSQPVQETK